jgi:ankyrin repeat protein
MFLCCWHSAGHRVILRSDVPHSCSTLQHEKTALHAAAVNGHAFVTSVLLTHPGVRPNETDADGLTARACAAMAGQADVVEVLSADSRVRPFNHAPAPAGLVNKAAYDGDVQALLRLLEGGASTEEADEVSRAAFANLNRNTSWGD